MTMGEYAGSGLEEERVEREKSRVDLKWCWMCLSKTGGCVEFLLFLCSLLCPFSRN